MIKKLKEFERWWKWFLSTGKGIAVLIIICLSGSVISYRFPYSAAEAGVILLFVLLTIISLRKKPDYDYYRIWVALARKLIKQTKEEEYIPALEKLTNEAENKKDASNLRPFFNKVITFEQARNTLWIKKNLLESLNGMNEDMNNERVVLARLIKSLREHLSANESTMSKEELQIAKEKIAIQEKELATLDKEADEDEHNNITYQNIIAAHEEEARKLRLELREMCHEYRKGEKHPCGK